MLLGKKAIKAAHFGSKVNNGESITVPGEQPTLALPGLLLPKYQATQPLTLRNPDTLPLLVCALVSVNPSSGIAAQSARRIQEQTGGDSCDGMLGKYGYNWISYWVQLDTHYSLLITRNSCIRWGLVKCCRPSNHMNNLSKQAVSQSGEKAYLEIGRAKFPSIIPT
jgi:hypothetical protein